MNTQIKQWSFFVQGLLVLLFFLTSMTGCGSGRDSQMAALLKKQPKSSGNNDDDDDVPAPISATKNTDTKKAGASDQDNPSAPSAAPPQRKNDTSENPILNDSSNADSEFLMFREKLLAKIKQRRETLSSVEKLEAVASAFSKYVTTGRSFPPRAIPHKNPVLSWRVAILPHLGYQELYDQFDLNQRYSAPMNKRLLELMPAEFETVDQVGKTTLVAPVDSYTAFGTALPARVNRIEDRVADTIAFVQVDAKHAVSWTSPKEYQLSKPDNRVGLLDSYEGFMVAAFGDGRVVKINSEISTGHFTAMLSYDRGDSFPETACSELELSDVSSPPTQTLAQSGSSPIPNGGSSEKSPVNKTASSTSPFASTASSTAYQSTPATRRLSQEADVALSKRQQNSALDLQIAEALISDSPELLSQFGWSKALRRPAINLRWYVGVSVPNEKIDTDPVARRLTRSKSVDRPGNQLLKQKTGQIGLDAAIVLRNLVSDGLMGKQLQQHVALLENPEGPQGTVTSKRQNDDKFSNDETLFDSRAVPELHFSGIEVAIGPNQNYHLQVCKRRGIDLLLLMDIDVRKVRQQTLSITTVSLIDVQTRKELLRLTPFNNLKIKADRENALEKDIVFTELQKLDRFCRNSVALTEMPSSLTRDNVLKRLKSIALRKEADKLPALLEGRYYFEQRLILLDDYRQFCRSILKDEKLGDAIAVGTADEKFDVIRQLLPENRQNL